MREKIIELVKAQTTKGIHIDQLSKLTKLNKESLFSFIEQIDDLYYDELERKVFFVPW